MIINIAHLIRSSCSVVSSALSTLPVIYNALALITLNPWILVFCQLCWSVNHGIPAFIFLIMNGTIRREFKKLICRLSSHRSMKERFLKRVNNPKIWDWPRSLEFVLIYEFVLLTLVLSQTSIGKFLTGNLSDQLIRRRIPPLSRLIMISKSKSTGTKSIVIYIYIYWLSSQTWVFFVFFAAEMYHSLMTIMVRSSFSTNENLSGFLNSHFSNSALTEQIWKNNRVKL